ncbi:MAG: P-loop NTPase, partial [Gammaproteobacteria bacterium]
PKSDGRQGGGGMNQAPEFAVTIGTSSRSDAQPCYAEPQESIAGIDNIVLVASGKGGVGKSTVTANLACAMARAGQRVGILDADLYGPSITRMMGTDRALPTDAEGRSMPVENHGVWTVSVANVLPPEAALAWKGPLVTQALLQMFHDIAWLGRTGHIAAQRYPL